jgi:hypothetical protein
MYPSERDQYLKVSAESLRPRKMAAASSHETILEGNGCVDVCFVD